MLVHRARPLLLTIALVALAWSPPARADIAPAPQRPTWDQHPPPTPEPPPEKELGRNALPWIAAGISALAVVAVARRRRALRRAEVAQGS